MNQRVLITGASHGIGKAAAERFAKEGCTLILNCRQSVEELSALEFYLKKNYSVDCISLIGDVSSPDFVKEMFEKTMERFGGIDILINNAGISHIGLLGDMSNEEWHRVMGINLEGKMAYSWMQIQAGATLQRSRYKEAEQWSENPNITPQKKMFRSPDVYGYFTSTFTPVKRFSASLTGTYTGSMLVQHLAGYIPEDREEKTRDFFDLNLKLAYDFPIFKSVTLQVNAGVQNIFDSYQDDFDKGAHRDAGYIYGPGIPRSYFVGCKISY